MTKKFIMLSLEDEASKSLGKVLGNKTSKKIIDLLAENEELSQKDISDELKIPLNTVEYNIKPLLDSGLIQRSKNFFWSRKGKKILMYSLSNKSIVISPKNKTIKKLKSIIPAVLISGLATTLIGIFNRVPKITEVKTFDSSEIMLAVPEAIRGATVYSSGLPIWAWFLIGSFAAIIIFTIFNWRKL